MKNTLVMDISKLGAQDQADWLRYNQNHIDFEKSYEFIEDCHLIKPGSDLMHVSGLNDYVEVSVEDFKKMLFPENHGLNYDFESCKYERYAELDISNDTLIAKIADFDKDKSCYSLPFLRSIMMSNNPDKLYFKLTIMPNQSKHTVVIKVEYNNTDKYYDYSQQPRK